MSYDKNKDFELRNRYIIIIISRIEQDITLQKEGKWEKSGTKIKSNFNIE